MAPFAVKCSLPLCLVVLLLDLCALWTSKQQENNRRRTVRLNVINALHLSVHLNRFARPCQRQQATPLAGPNMSRKVLAAKAAFSWQIK